MLIATNWKEYEILDCGDGAKLERWGIAPDSLVLSRPDPQIIWPKENPEIWGGADGVYTRRETGSGSPDASVGAGWSFPNTEKKPQERWQIKYALPENIGELKLLISPTDFKHMGLFPEQAVNWDWMAEKIQNEKRKAKNNDSKIKVLNLFAYTGGASIACAKAGAEVTHVDASKGIVSWAKENADLNNVGDNVRLIVDDVMKFVLREQRRGVKYNAIIMDPPSYGRGKSGETWKIEKMLYPLLTNCREILVNKPLFLLLNSYTTGLGPTVVKNVLESVMENYGGIITSEEIALPITKSNKFLPAGLSGRWCSGQTNQDSTLRRLNLN